MSKAEQLPGLCSRAGFPQLLAGVLEYRGRGLPGYCVTPNAVDEKAKYWDIGPPDRNRAPAMRFSVSLRLVRVDLGNEKVSVHGGLNFNDRQAARCTCLLSEFVMPIGMWLISRAALIPIVPIRIFPSRLS